MDTFNCPQCGGYVPSGAKACPHCGSDEQTGWSDEAVLNRLGVASSYDEEDYDETIRREFGGETRHPTLRNTVFAVTAVVLVVLFFLYFAC